MPSSALGPWAARPPFFDILCVYGPICYGLSCCIPASNGSCEDKNALLHEPKDPAIRAIAQLYALLTKSTNLKHGVLRSPSRE
jgi:hypothetical protein